MNQKAPIEAPPQVVGALDELERATSPAALGHAYQTVLTWRRGIRGLSRPWEFLQSLLFCALLILIAFSPQFLRLELSEFERGAVFGLTIANLVRVVSDWSSRARPSPTFLQRIDDAIGRWRHAVPAMRDFPK